MGWTVAVHPGREKLPLPHRPRRRGVALRLENEILDVSVEARKGATSLDSPGTAWASNRPLSLEQSATLRARVVPATNAAGRLQDSGFHSHGPTPLGKRRSVSAGGIAWKGDS